jgi:hypothetical protein
VADQVLAAVDDVHLAVVVLQSSVRNAAVRDGPAGDPADEVDRFSIDTTSMQRTWEVVRFRQKMQENAVLSRLKYGFDSR